MPINHKILPIRRVPMRRRRLTLGSKRQRRFLLTVKLLLRSLEATNHPEGLLLAEKVKVAVRECIRQNRAGDKRAIPLQSNAEARIRGIVGQKMFAESIFLVDFFQARQCLRH